MSEREEHTPIEDEVEGPKVIHLHNRDFAGTSFAANETEQTEDKRDPNAEPDIDDRRNSLPNVQDHGLTT
jgi:hypothetical protein